MRPSTAEMLCLLCVHMHYACVLPSSTTTSCMYFYFYIIHDCSAARVLVATMQTKWLDAHTQEKGNNARACVSTHVHVEFIIFVSSETPTRASSYILDAILCVALTPRIAAANQNPFTCATELNIKKKMRERLTLDATQPFS